MVEFVGAGFTIGLIGRIGRIGVAGEGRVRWFRRFGRFGRSQTAAAFHGRLIIARHPGLSIKSFILNSTALK